MDEFYDLKEYMAVGIRRMKGVMGIIVLVTAFMAFARGGSVYGSQPVGMPMLKGAVWGGMTGVVVSFAYVFAVYVSDQRIGKAADLDLFGVNVIGICRRKPRGKCLDHLLKRMEGYTSFRSIEELADYLHPWVGGIGAGNQGVILTGCTDSPCGAELAERLNELAEDGRVYQWVPSVLHSSDTIQLCRDGRVSVILIECFGESVKRQVFQEMEYFNRMDIKVDGIVGIEG